MTKCLQYHYNIVSNECYNNAEYGNSSSADSRLRTGGELAWTTITIEIIRDPEGATIPPIADRAAQGAAIRRPTETVRTPNGDPLRMREAPIAQIAGIPRRAEAPPAQIAAILRRIEARPVRIAAILPPTGRTMARAAPLPAAVRARRVPAAATRPPRGAHPVPAAAPAEAAMAVPPARPAHRERRKRSGATSFAFNRDSSL